MKPEQIRQLQEPIGASFLHLQLFRLAREGVAQLAETNEKTQRLIGFWERRESLEIAIANERLHPATEVKPGKDFLHDKLDEYEARVDATLAPQHIHRWVLRIDEGTESTYTECDECGAHKEDSEGRTPSPTEVPPEDHPLCKPRHRRSGIWEKDNGKY